MKLSSFLFKRVTGYVLPVAILCQTFTVNAQDKKPNILVIMGDDIGMWNIGAYHRGLMAGKTPNLDKIAREGMIFTDYYAEASCTAAVQTLSRGNCPYAQA